MPRILSVIGARPQFVKAAVFRQVCSAQGIDEILMHTGQHFDDVMSLGIFDELGVKRPDHIMSLERRTHAGMTAEMLLGVEEAIHYFQPDVVNVFGDTNTTLAAALAAVKLKLPVTHIEAGLRSYDFFMPEEINRKMCDHISTHLFCPTTLAVKNLELEGLSQNVFHVGDIMYDCVKLFRNHFVFPKSFSFEAKKSLAVITIHRAESLETAEKLQKILDFCNGFSERYNLIFPVHPNTYDKIKKFDNKIGEIKMISPLRYVEMQGLLSEADLVLTDSGGLQKEAYFHNCDCITLRDVTEWQETIEHGWNRLWQQTEGKHVRFNKKPIVDYGVGDACEKILNKISQI